MNRSNNSPEYPLFNSTNRFEIIILVNQSTLPSAPHTIFYDIGNSQILSKTKYTIFRSGNYGHGNDIFLHAQQITNDIIDVKDGNWNTTCLDYIFGPKDSSEMNNKFQVYTGDLLLNIPKQPQN